MTTLVKNRKVLLVVCGVSVILLGGVFSGQRSEGVDFLRDAHTSLLAAASIVFAIAFANVRYWPSLELVSWKVFFPQWVLSSILMYVVSPYLNEDDNWRWVSLEYSGWVIVNMLGIYSCFRILQLSNSGPMNEVLGKRIAKAKKSDIEAIQLAVKDSLAVGDSNTINDIFNQIIKAGKRGQLNQDIAQTIQLIYSSIFEDYIRNGKSYELLLGILKNLEKLYGGIGEGLSTKSLAELLEILARYQSRIYLAAKDGALEERQAALILSTTEESVRKILNHVDISLQANNALPGGENRWPTEYTVEIWKALNRRPTEKGLFSIYLLFESVVGERFNGDYFKGAHILGDFIQRLDAGTKDEGVPSGSNISSFAREDLLWNICLMVGRSVYSYHDRADLILDSVDVIGNNISISLLRQIESLDALPYASIEDGIQTIMEKAIKSRADAEMVETFIIGYLSVHIILQLRGAEAWRFLSSTNVDGRNLLRSAVVRINGIWPGYCKLVHSVKVIRAEKWSYFSNVDRSL